MELYTPVLFLGGLATLFVVGSLVTSVLVGPGRYNRAKYDSYECGIEPTPQPLGEHRMFGKFVRPAAIFDPTAPAADTDRLRRALSLGVRYRNTLGSLRVVLGHVAPTPWRCAAR